MTQSFNQPTLESNADPSINKSAARLIRRKAGELAGRSGFTPSDRDDIEQELTPVLLRRLAKFDPAIDQAQAIDRPCVQASAANKFRTTSIVEGLLASIRSSVINLPLIEELKWSCSRSSVSRPGDLYGALCLERETAGYGRDLQRSFCGPESGTKTLEVAD